MLGATIKLIVGGNVLEKIIIYRIMHHVYSNNFLNYNQFGFTPKKRAIGAALANI